MPLVLSSINLKAFLLHLQLGILSAAISLLLSADILCGLAITMPAFMAYENSAAEQSVTSYNGYNAEGEGLS